MRLRPLIALCLLIGATLCFACGGGGGGDLPAPPDTPTGSEGPQPAPGAVGLNE